MSSARALSGILFFPRGGSAHVVRSLARELPAHGWATTVLSGSAPGEGDATRFYDGLELETVDFGPALASADPLRHDPPMHPSYEDRPAAADRIFAALDDDLYERQVRAWIAALDRAGCRRADILHLHHLTPLHEAAARCAPEIPVVGHLHGTELLMLEAIAEGSPGGWTHAGEWRQRMRRWAAGCARTIVLSEGHVARAHELLGIDPERCVVIANGFDASTFRPTTVDRFAHWRRYLVTEPRGWAPGEGPGSVVYPEEAVAALADGPVLLYVGRFTAVKRLGLLIRAFARARERFATRPALVLLGGHPGEWEDEHPLDAVAAAGAQDVFLAGWHGHDALPAFLNASDAVVLPSVREQFGQVLVEGMACGLPAVAVDRHGPAEIIEDGTTGWLVEPDDLEGLAAALVAVVNDPAERARRGRAARAAVVGRYAWPALAGRVADAYAEARALGAPMTPAPGASAAPPPA